MTECGTVAAELLVGGCERVVIVWDLYPAWRRKGERPCRKEDRDDIIAALRSSRVDLDRVGLVCIEEELEAWLLADERAIGAALSKPHRKIRVKRQRRPERDNPKTRMNRIFNQQVGRSYRDLQHAEMIANAMPNLSRLKRVATFRRFALKVADVEL